DTIRQTRQVDKLVSLEGTLQVPLRAGGDCEGYCRAAGVQTERVVGGGGWIAEIADGHRASRVSPSPHQLVGTVGRAVLEDQQRLPGLRRMAAAQRYWRAHGR